MEAKRIYHQHIRSIRNVQGNALGRRKLTPDRNLDLHKRNEERQKGNDMGKYIRFLLII